MTAQAINVAIAELCGRKDVPNYYADLNACAEFEATLTDEQWMPYLHYIYDQVPGFREGSYWYENFETQRQVASATAPQRSIAFLHVHGKWSDA
jgi:hypothetical protein